MADIVACALDIPSLSEAVRARGMSLVPFVHSELDYAQAALLGLGRCSAIDRIAGLRARGWRGQVVLVLEQDCGTSIASALDAGADDAVALPASAGEIAARLAARLRRSTAPIVVGPLRIDPTERQATRDNKALDLLPREYALLLYLARAGGRCVSRAELLAAVWGLHFDPGTNVIEVHVSRLRARLDRGRAAMLHTEKRQGYRLVPPLAYQREEQERKP